MLACETIGTLFIRSITMVVIPLVVASLLVGIATLGDIRTLGRVGGKTFAYFLGTTVAAALIGLMIATAGRVGQGSGALAGDSSPVTAGGAPDAVPSVGQLLINLVPQNIVSSAATGICCR